MKLYINEQMVLPALGSVVLRKRRSDAAATLTATLYTAPADTYFLELSVAVGDRVRLLDDAGEEVFLGSIHDLHRTPQQVRITAYDAGLYLTRNELRGVFSGTPKDIAAQVAKKLELPLGTIETAGGWKTIVSRSGESAFSILRQAVGEDREISIRNGALWVTKSAYMVYVLQPSQVLEVGGSASLEHLVDRCEVVDRKGRLLAAAAEPADLALYGQMQAVLLQDGTDPEAQAKNALRGREMGGEISVLGNTAYLCGCAVELHRPEWGLDGVYAVTAAEHRWEKGLYTTNMELEFVR